MHETKYILAFDPRIDLCVASSWSLFVLCFLHNLNKTMSLYVDQAVHDLFKSLVVQIGCSTFFELGVFIFSEFLITAMILSCFDQAVSFFYFQHRSKAMTIAFFYPQQLVKLFLIFNNGVKPWPYFFLPTNLWTFSYFLNIGIMLWTHVLVCQTVNFFFSKIGIRLCAYVCGCWSKLWTFLVLKMFKNW